MSTSPLSSDEVRAAAEVHRELGAEYRDAVVESFLARVEGEVAARAAGRRQLEMAEIAKRRLALGFMALGTVSAGIPWSFFSFAVMYRDVTDGQRMLEPGLGWALSDAGPAGAVRPGQDGAADVAAQVVLAPGDARGGGEKVLPRSRRRPASWHGRGRCPGRTGRRR